MTWEELKQTVNELSFRDWAFDLGYDSSWDRRTLGRPQIRVTFEVPDSPISRIHHGRWWPLSYHMTKGEIVQTALKAVLTALEHEAREDFLYRGRAVLGPHLDIDALWKVADRTAERAHA